MADQRQKIISSVFSRRNATGNLEEIYVSHVKIWEDAGQEGGGRKPRYILLSQANNGSGFIHKSKLNTNGTFSVGKTWRLAELRAIQVINPLAFNVTLSRTYRWQTENQAEQSAFLEALVQLFRRVAPSAPLQLEGLTISEEGTAEPHIFREDLTLSTRTPSPRLTSELLHPSAPSQLDREYEPSQYLSSPTRLQNPKESSSRPPSPGDSNRGYSSKTLPRGLVSSRTGPPPITEQSQSITSRPRPGRHPSNAIPQTNQIPLAAVVHQALAHPQLADLPSSSVLRGPQNSLPTMASPHSNLSLRSRAPSPATTNIRVQPSRGDVTDNLSRRDQNTRISFYDPANQGTLDRLIISERVTRSDGEADDENTIATMSNVEEMIEGYEWASDSIIGRRTVRGAADLIEARLLNELMALDKANIHSFLESDDRIGVVLKYMDDAISELDNMESLVSSYKIHLNTVSDDIQYIQSQNRGLQVQTQNQRALLNELENLLQTVNVSQEALMTLTQESLEKSKSMQRLEEAAAELYQALQAGRETDMAATMERLQEYRTHNSQFCKRILDFLSIMFTAQSTLLLGQNNGILPGTERHQPIILQHQEMESYLGRYAGLMLYLKEMDETLYAKLCAAYFSAASELHSAQIKALLSIYVNLVRRAPEDGNEQGFSLPAVTGISKGAAGMRRAGTIIRSPIENRQKDKDRAQDGELRVAEAFGLILEQLAPSVSRENEFIMDFLQTHDAAFTFADYMGLDNYFRRQAARTAGLSQATTKLVRGAMDLIFGFLPAELKAWLDNALAKDPTEIVGVLVVLERFSTTADERENQTLLTFLLRQHTRLKGIFDRHINEQIQDIEQTKLSSKKRQGVAQFVKYFPTYVSRVENHLIGADDLDIRTSVNASYEKIVQTIFDSLKHMAKMSGEGEDKGQLNYHVILIENMHHFVAETSQMEAEFIASFSRRAEAIYDENLNAYIKIVLRRPFAKIIDYFEGVERLLKTTAPTEISNNNLYSKSALRKIVKEFSAKEIRKQIDTLSTRVAKHFVEASGKSTTDESGGIAPGTVMVGVWKACEEELLRITDLFSKRISQCYGDSGVLLDYTKSDIEGAFRRHRGVGS